MSFFPGEPLPPGDVRLNESAQVAMPRPLPAKRPSFSDLWVRKRTAADLAELLYKKYPKNFGDSEREEVEEDLLGALGEGDGHKMARALEDGASSWDCDMGMVEILDLANSIRFARLAEAERLWIREGGRALDLPVGARVRVPYWDRETNRTSAVEGEVRKLDSEHLRYHVCCPSLGHVREDEILNGKFGTTALVVNAEDVEALEETGGRS